MLKRADLDPDPIVQFNGWFDDAAAAATEVNAMYLSTVSTRGQPAVRTVLLKDFDDCHE